MASGYRAQVGPPRAEKMYRARRNVDRLRWSRAGAGAGSRTDGARQPRGRRQLPWLTGLGLCTPTTRRGIGAATSEIRTRSAPSASSATSVTLSRCSGGRSCSSATRWADCTPGVWPRSDPNWSPRSSSRTWRRISAGRTTGPWEPWLHALPVEFATAKEVFDEFGAVAGQYFLDAFDRTDTGWRLHGHVGAVDRDRSGVGDPRLLGPVARGAGACAADRGWNVRHPTRADASNVRDRSRRQHICMPRRRPPGARRRTQRIPRGCRPSFLATLAQCA